MLIAKFLLVYTTHLNGGFTLINEKKIPKNIWSFLPSYYKDTFFVRM